jgi:hypothetical protein
VIERSDSVKLADFVMYGLHGALVPDPGSHRRAARPIAPPARAVNDTTPLGGCTNARRTNPQQFGQTRNRRREQRRRFKIAKL